MKFVPCFLNYLMVCTIPFNFVNDDMDYIIFNAYFPDFFKLMNEVENEDLVFTLETIVDKFGEEMAPYALGLCQNLVTLEF